MTDDSRITFAARTPRTPRSFARRQVAVTFARITATALLPLLGAAAALELWRGNIRVPFAYRSDSLFYEALIKGVLEHGWVLENPSLGAPFVQQLADFPQQTEALHLLLIKLIGLAAQDAGTAMNVFYLLSFPLTALAAAVFFRSVGISWPVSLGASLLFALLPYHFHRGVQPDPLLTRHQHVLFTAYYGVPLAAFLAVATWEGRTFFGLGAATRRTLGSSPRARHVARAYLLPVVLCAIIASATIYFAAFAILLLGFATMAALMRGLPRSVAASGVILMVLIAAVVLLHLTPSIALRAAEGVNTDTPVRSALATQMHSLQLADLVLPMSGHRIEQLAELAERRAATSRLDESAVGLGFAAVLGLGVMVIAALRRDRDGTSWRRRRLGTLMALTAAAFVIGMTGGISALISLLATPQLRAWSRIELFIGLFALAALALVTEGWTRRVLARRPARTARLATAAGLAVALVIGILDQTSPALVPAYDELSRSYVEDRAFFRDIEARLPAGTAVLQLPVTYFPEEAGHVQMKPYLHTRTLRWSYGLVKGREAGWQSYLAHGAERVPVRLALLADYGGVLVKRDLYEGGGQAVEEDLRTATGTEPLVSPDGDWAFYDLRPALPLIGDLSGAEIAAAREQLLEPVRIRWSEGFDPAFSDGARRIREVAERATLEFTNPTGDTRRVRFAARVATISALRGAVAITWPDGTTDRMQLRPSGVFVSRSLEVPPGGATVALRAFVLEPPMRPFGRRAFRIVDAWVIDEALLALVEPPTAEAP